VLRGGDLPGAGEIEIHVRNTNIYYSNKRAPLHRSEVHYGRIRFSDRFHRDAELSLTRSGWCALEVIVC
jgi:hypothetical protein